jgi:hypothetical protein
MSDIWGSVLSELEWVRSRRQAEACRTFGCRVSPSLSVGDLDDKLKHVGHLVVAFLPSLSVSDRDELRAPRTSLSLNFSSTDNFPHCLHSLSSHTVNLIVHVNGAADMIRDDCQSLPNAVTTHRATNIQVAVLLR